MQTRLFRVIHHIGMNQHKTYDVPHKKGIDGFMEMKSFVEEIKLPAHFEVEQNGKVYPFIELIPYGIDENP